MRGGGRRGGGSGVDRRRVGAGEDAEVGENTHVDRGLRVSRLSRVLRALRVWRRLPEVWECGGGGDCHRGRRSLDY